MVRSCPRSGRSVVSWDTSSVVVEALAEFHDGAYVERSIPTIDHGEGHRRKENAEHHSFVYMLRANAEDVAVLPNVRHSEGGVPMGQIRRSRQRENPLGWFDTVVLTVFF